MHAIIELLNSQIEARHLLKHPFYVAWSEGKLTLEDLREYSKQYFPQVRAFPAYLSEMHSRAEDLEFRKIIARNLAEEEAGPVTHPELWLNFASGLGADPSEVLTSAAGDRVRGMTDTFREAARGETGLAAVAMYCYEKQVPRVAAAKIAGLKERYGVDSPATLEYFAVHEIADVEHAAEWERLIARANPDPAEAAAVADRVLEALWGALDEIDAARRLRSAARN
ncbi:MAG TPA: CADD family putative folate metabolism protein [Bryobacteraceae bacterium]|nr:CADD family putative folate metabolism protein [Bryobacteraceae bacterium]